MIAAEMTDTLDGNDDGTNTPLDEQEEDAESGDGGLPQILAPRWCSRPSSAWTWTFPAACIARGEMYMNIELRHLFAH